MCSGFCYKKNLGLDPKPDSDWIRINQSLDPDQKRWKHLPRTAFVFACMNRGVKSKKKLIGQNFVMFWLWAVVQIKPYSPKIATKFYIWILIKHPIPTVALIGRTPCFFLYLEPRPLFLARFYQDLPRNFCGFFFLCD
jgi:hypothetical protein